MIIAGSSPGVRAGDATARLLVLTLCLDVIVLSLIQTLVVPALTEIAGQLHTTTATVSWAVTANLLAAAVLTPLLSRLGDLHGKRRVLLGVLAVVVAGSLLAAATASVPLLVLGRVLQGASYGIFPLAMGVLRDEIRTDRLTFAMAVVSGMLGLGSGLGVGLAGMLTRNHGDYHQIFWLATVAGFLALLLTAVAVPHRDSHASGTVDWFGAGLLGAALVLLLLPLSEGNDWGWTSAATLCCFTACAVLFAVWLGVENRVGTPLVAPRLLAHRPVLITNLAGLFLGVGMFTGFLGISHLVETPRAEAGYGFSASVLATSNVYLLPGVVAGVLVVPFSGRVVRRHGGRATLLAATVLGVTGFALLALLHDATWEVILGGVIVNLSITFGYAAIPPLLVLAVPPGETAIANSINSIARTVGSALASAMTVTLLTSRLLPTGMTRESSYTIAFTIAAAGFAVSGLLVGLGLKSGRRLEPADPGRPPVMSAA
ncbi:MFS transporter [Candidatus Protofrankia californiensis]|uniref:MFS transporter n=1 Tax=Candidatus Protofrankia californiensis TaxID=1839754 RepID=UPI001040E933|nr:MFS transporter [Candidatus Protofrankia californiensis]